MGWVGGSVKVTSHFVRSFEAGKPFPRWIFFLNCHFYINTILLSRINNK